MGAIWQILRRELGAYLGTPIGGIVLAATLAIDGLLFNALAIGGEARPSAQVLEIFFYCLSGTTLVAAVFLSMRLIAEETQNDTLVLLTTAPIREWQIVLGKFLSAWAMLALSLLLSLHMPLLVYSQGKISWGHIAAGYLGLLLLGGAALALGLLASALAPNQLVAAIGGGALITGFLLLWQLARVASPPLDDLLAALSLHDRHFRPFMRGIVSLADVLFYLTLIYVALVCSARALEARRWR